MTIDIITLFPEMFKGALDESILKMAQTRGLVTINIHNLRDYATDNHKTVDDRPYGGGKGMVLKVDVVDLAISNIVKDRSKTRIIAMSPQGKTFNQAKAKELSLLNNIVLLCGHYEGFDERIVENLIDEEISIGNYVLTGGELPAMVVVDSITRLIPGVLETEATENESFFDGETLDYPVYTRPEEYKGWQVPEILKKGNHKEINTWRTQKALEKTGRNSILPS